MNASRWLKEAAEVISESPSALQLRYLQALQSISAENSSTIIFPLPMDVLPQPLNMRRIWDKLNRNFYNGVYICKSKKNISCIILRKKVIEVKKMRNKSRSFILVKFFKFIIPNYLWKHPFKQSYKLQLNQFEPQIISKLVIRINAWMCFVRTTSWCSLR